VRGGEPATTTAPLGTIAGLDQVRAMWGSGPNDMWAVGSQSGLPSSGIAVHSDGSTWSSPTTVPGCRNVYSVGGVSR